MDAVRVEDLLIADQDEILRLGLGDQHAVEWVFVIAGEHSCTLGVFDRDWKFRKTELSDVLTQGMNELVGFR